MGYDGFEVELEGVFVDAEPVPTDSNRWVLAWAAGVVAVLVLLAWWAGRGSDPEAAPSPEAGPEPIPAEPLPGDPGPVPASEASIPDATTGPGVETGDGYDDGYGSTPTGPTWAEVGEGSGYDLLAVDRQGHVVVLDFDTGSIARFGLASVDRGLGTESAVMRTGGRLAAVYEGRLILAAPAAEPEVLVEEAFGWRGLPGDPLVFWGYRGDGTLVAVTADGSAVELPDAARPVAVWDGKLLVQAVDDIVLVPVGAPGSAALFAHGRVVSASAGAVVYQTCEVLDCRLWVGRPGEPEWIEVPGWAEAPLSAGGAALSPDGTLIIRPWRRDSGAGLIVYDSLGAVLVAEAAGPLPFDDFLRRAVWSSDNRLAAVETGPEIGPGQFRVMRTGDGAMARLPEDIAQVIEFVPEPPTPWPPPLHRGRAASE